MHVTKLPLAGLRFLTATTLLLLGAQASTADEGFGIFHPPADGWYEAGDAMVDASDSKRLAGKLGRWRINQR